MKRADRHLVILGIRGLPAAHGGFESFAERLAPWMVNAGWRVTVYCQGSKTGSRYTDMWNGCRRIHLPVASKGALSTIEFDVKSTIDAVQQKGVLLTLGYNTGFLAIYTALFRQVNIINMDGIEWKRAKYNFFEKLYLRFNERIAAKAGTALIADHPEIANHHANHAPQKKEIFMIPYGSDKIEVADRGLLQRLDVDAVRYMTVIARPEPENSLLEIVQAFSRKPRDGRLVVLGKYSKDHPYQAQVLQAASADVIFAGAIYDKPTLNALRLYCTAYIHGHQVGGTNPSLVEALGAGNAIIAHDNVFNRWVAGNSGCYFSNVDECEMQIEKIFDNKDLQQLKCAEALMRWESSFDWPRVLIEYQKVIERYS